MSGITTEHQRRADLINSRTVSGGATNCHSANEIREEAMTEVPDSGSHLGGGSLVIVVDHEDADRDALASALTRAGYRVRSLASADALIEIVEQLAPALVILEPNLPGVNSVSVLTEMREQSSVPLIVLSAVGDEEDRVIGLELGADDYVTKPHSVREVVARVRAVLRRPRSLAWNGSELDFGRLVVRTQSREVLVDGVDCGLTPREFDLFLHMAHSPRSVFSREELLDAVWNSSGEWQSLATVTEHVRRIRSKVTVADGHGWIDTVWGVGYRFTP